jgi:hypothetical protein
MFTIYQPIFAECRINNDSKKLFKYFSLTVGFFYCLFVILSMFLIFFGNSVLYLIRSNTFLPVFPIIVIYSIVSLLEQNHSLFSTLIVIRNNVPFVKSSLLAGFFIFFGTYIVLEHLQFGLFGLILVPGVVQIVYANWKWPLVVCKEMKISFWSFLTTSFCEVLQYSKREIDELNRFFKK